MVRQPDPRARDRRAAEADRRRTASAASRRTRRSSKRRWRPAPTTTRSCARSTRAGASDRRRVLGSRHHRHRARGRRAAPGVRRARRRRRLRVGRGVARPRARHRGDDPPGQGAVGAPRPAERDDQDPGDARGHPRDRRHPRRGHQRQRHADLQPRALPAGHRARSSPASSSAPPRGGDIRDARVGRVVLRQPGRHRDRSPAARGAPAAGEGRGRQRQARVPAVPRRALRRPVGASSRRTGARVQRPLWASTSTKNPAYSPTLYVDELVGATR